MLLSKLKMISIGIVSEHKKLTTHFAKIHPAELLGEIDGELRSIPVELVASGVDFDNNEYTVKIQGDTSLTCEWLHLNSGNRLTSPDIRKGEQVIIWQFGETDKYYWTPMGRDVRLRRLETVIWAFSNIPDPEAEVDALTPENAYYFEVSTHTKQITLKTNKHDGEPFAYTIQLNTKDGNYTITDDVGNYVQLDSAETTIDLTNKDGTFWRLNKKNIRGYAPDSMYLVAENNVDIQCKDYKLYAKNSISTETKSAIHKAKTINNEADSILNKAQSIINDAPTVTCTGLLVCASISVAGGAGGGGSADISVPLNATSGITTSSITADSWNNYPGRWDIT